MINSVDPGYFCTDQNIIIGGTVSPVRGAPRTVYLLALMEHSSDDDDDQDNVLEYDNEEEEDGDEVIESIMRKVKYHGRMINKK